VVAVVIVYSVRCYWNWVGLLAYLIVIESFAIEEVVVVIGIHIPFMMVVKT